MYLSHLLCNIILQNVIHFPSLKYGAISVEKNPFLLSKKKCFNDSLNIYKIF